MFEWRTLSRKFLWFALSLNTNNLEDFLWKCNAIILSTISNEVDDEFDVYLIIVVILYPDNDCWQFYHYY